MVLAGIEMVNSPWISLLLEIRSPHPSPPPPPRSTEHRGGENGGYLDLVTAATLQDGKATASFTPKNYFYFAIFKGKGQCQEISDNFFA